MRKHALLWLLLAAYLVMGTLYAHYTPDWQAPDEPAHYNYVRQLAGGALPLMEPGDYDQQYLETIVGSRFDPDLPISPITYEDWQPPLYYLLQTPVYQLTDGSLLAMRLLSVLLGAGVVVLTYFIGLALFPDQAWLALGAAVFVAFLPQHLAILSSVNNDSLAELIIAGLLLLMVVPWRPERRAWYLLGLGVLLGAGLLTKATVYIMAPVVAGFLLVRYWGRWGELVRAGLLVFGPALLLGGLWWARNAVVYGDLDVLARQTHNEVVVGQPRTEEWIARYGLGETVRRFVSTTFNSFWGQFGWMAAPLPGWAYPPLALLSLAAAVGLGVALVRWSRVKDGTAVPWLSLAVLVATLLLTTGVHVGYNLTFVQHQGRYLFPALVPLALGVSVGLGTWLRPLIRRYAWTAYLLPLGLALILSSLAAYSLWRVIPTLSPA
jgi:4-amino-4-deoxy-L-arabinose transferase-like glycosyltransferase